MARTLKEQPRFMSRAVNDPIQFGDTAPVHSADVFDLMRQVNWMQSYGEPSFQFFHDASAVPNVGGVARGRCLVGRRLADAYPTTGLGFLGQVPIYVPTDAFRMNVSLGMYRHGPDEASLGVNVTQLYMYLSAGPCLFLDDPFVPDPTPHEASRTFSPAYIQGPYAEFHDLLLPASFSDGSTIYLNMTYNSWGRETLLSGSTVTDPVPGTVGFAAKGSANVNSLGDNPWAYLIIAVAFDSMAPGETVSLAEGSVWFGYE